MNNFCRNLSILLAFAIILGTSSLTVFGENSSAAKQDAAESVVSSAAASLMASMPDNNVQYSEDYKFDYSLGLFELLDDDFWKTEQVTRADFAVIVAKMLKTNTDGYPKYNRTPYSDIDNTNYAYPAICYLTEVGILSGDGNSEFRPNDSILVNEASKMIMCALGYGTACEETKGGFPDGYTTFALQQGIYNGIDVNYTSTLSAMQMSRMVRNAMEAYLMENIVYNTDGSLSLSISETKTLLSEIYKIYTATGYVTGTYFSQLGDTSVDLENEVVISDVYVTKGSNSEHFENMIYQTADGIDMESILGYEVNIYFMEDVSGYRRNYISYCEPRKSVNEKHIIPADNIIEFTNEKIVYTVVTTDYKGEMLFTFENGKMAKVALSNYETKTNRKKLIGAYGNKSPICDIRLLDEDKDVVLMSDNNRVLLVNTEKIPLKATKSTQGIQVITLRKKDAKVVKVVDKEQCTVEDIEHYRPKNIPAAGGILRGEDNQISLI